MDMKRLGTIFVVVICLVIFFFSAFKSKREKGSEPEFPKAEYVEGAFHDQGEMWDFLHAHEFVCVEQGDTMVLTVKNFELFLNGKPYSSKLQLSDFQYSGAGLSGIDVKGDRFDIAVMKQHELCTMSEISKGRSVRTYFVRNK